MQFRSSIVLFSDESLLSPDWARALFSVLTEPATRPTRIGRGEPLRENVEKLSPAEYIHRWPFLWKSLKTRGMYTVTPPGGLARVHIDIDSEFPLDSAAALFRKVVAGTRPAYAALAVLTPDEVERGRRQGTVFMNGPLKGPRDIPVFDPNWVRHLSKGIPSLYWLNAFGEPFLTRLGREQLESSGAVVVEPVGDDILLVQLCRSDEVGSAVEGAARESAIKHLGPQWFL